MSTSEDVQYKRLYELYKKLYNLVIVDEADGWNLWGQCKEGDALAEKRGTELLSLEKRIEIHEIAFMNLKKKYPYISGVNGLMPLFDEDDYEQDR